MVLEAHSPHTFPVSELGVLHPTKSVTVQWPVAVCGINTKCNPINAFQGRLSLMIMSPTIMADNLMK